MFKLIVGLILIQIAASQSPSDIKFNLVPSYTGEHKPGSCPSYKSPYKNCVITHFCENDSDCVSDKKCCLTECGRKCLKSEFAAPMTAATKNKFKNFKSDVDDTKYKCPKFAPKLNSTECQNFTLESNNTRCVSSNSCSSGTICCLSECGMKECVKGQVLKTKSNLKKLSFKGKNRNSNTNRRLNMAYNYDYNYYDYLYGNGDAYNNYNGYNNFYNGYGIYDSSFLQRTGSMNNLQRRIPPQFGSRLNPHIGLPLPAMRLQNTPDFVSHNQNRKAISPAQSRLPKFNLNP